MNRPPKFSGQMLILLVVVAILGALILPRVFPALF